ncbi:hypothetical protein niasHS_006495 [Heterodera schachtii]|uniref:Hemimethylated DNA-binding domain-containing protein n=1 Tax=Heterodera schachtii TaxID=97005 RepID=A0ABD2JHF2_HETSC
MVELSPTLVFVAILFSAPLQFYLSARSTSDAQFYLHEFVQQVREVYGRYFSAIFGGWDLFEEEDEVEEMGHGKMPNAGEEDTVDEDSLGEKGEVSRDLFGGSDEPRHPRPPHIKYRVGQVVRHRIHNYRGVIIAWDEKAKAPEWWIKKVHGDVPVDEPNYTLLIDTRDRLIPQIAYVVERNIVLLSSGAIVHPLVKHYFESFDGTCYKSRPWHKKVYPND